MKTVTRAIMGRVPLLFLVLFMVGTELCFASTLAWSSRRTPEDKSSRLVHEDYPSMKLTTAGITADGYKAFIAELRQRLRSSKDMYGIPLLPRRNDSTTKEQILRVHLSNKAGETAIFEINVTSARPAGPFRDFYPSLERIGHRKRQEIKLGTGALEESISTLSWADDYPSLLGPSFAHAYLVITQMVTDAARFRYIENEVSLIIRDGVDSAPDPSVIQLEDSWERLSSEIQGSNQGMFRDPVPLRRRDGSWFEVSNVQSVAASMSLMMSVPCSRSSNSLHSRKLSPPLIRLVTSSSSSGPSDSDDCPVNDDVEPTLQIAGPGGMCVAPRDGQYNNGNAVVLSPCKSSSSQQEDQHQLWTFKGDGTIRSKGKCMAAYLGVPSEKNYIMIDNCAPSVDVFRWRVWPNGTITSGTTSFVLSMASSAGVGADVLTLGENQYSTGQSWLPTNNTEPSVAPIVGLFGFCMQATTEDDVMLTKCVDAAQDQAWALYQDGSIRPAEKRSRCLAAVEKLVRIVDCDPTSSLQRWLFANDGAIVNPASRLVMDVQGYVGSGLYVFMDAARGTAGQQWQALHP